MNDRERMQEAGPSSQREPMFTRTTTCASPRHSRRAPPSQATSRVESDALRRVVESQELERRRLARELHDQSGQEPAATASPASPARLVGAISPEHCVSATSREAGMWGSPPLPALHGCGHLREKRWVTDRGRCAHSRSPFRGRRRCGGRGGGRCGRRGGAVPLNVASSRSSRRASASASGAGRSTSSVASRSRSSA